MNIFEHTDVKTGDLLISEPFLPDPNFSRSVVLICNDSNGHVGFVLNQMTDLFVSDVLKSWEDRGIHIYIGGPVDQNTLHFIHPYGESLTGSVQITDNLYWGGDLEELKEKIDLCIFDKAQIRFFVGYSGWSEGQLKNELVEKSWIVLKSHNVNLLNTEPSQLWREILKGKGGEYQQLANYPIDPNLN